jgi:UDP-2-acetamido-3-amino-2,3-dideoxy-glucuronate N-acetyltransferase
MIHLLSDVQSNKIGEKTNIWQYVVVLKDAIIGKNCNICSHCFIENDVVIGDQVTIKSGVQIWDGIRIGDLVFIGPNVTFTNDLIPRSKNYPSTFKKTNIEKGASIGANSTIIGGVSIGIFAFIGAGSLVTKNIPPYTVWYGVPAKHKGFVTKDGIILNMELRDKSGNLYELVDGEPIKIIKL